MLLIEGILGNIHRDEPLAATYEEYETDDRVERIVLDENDRKRSRLRTTTDRGTDVGIVVDRAGLSAGDVIAHDDERIIIITAERRKALVIELDAVEDVAMAFECGHHLGNQHRTLTIEDGRAYIPISEERAHVERVIERTLGDVPINYEQVDPSTFEKRDQPTEHHSQHRHGEDNPTHDHEH